MSSATATPSERVGEWLRVAPRANDSFEAALEDHFGEAQHGDLLARCALAVLARDASARLASLRADWLAPLPPREPLALRVEPLLSDRSCVEVRAAASEPICRATAWLASSANGLSYQDPSLPAGLPDPETLPSTVEYARSEGWPEAYAFGPVEFRRVGPLRPDRASGESSDHVTWLKLRAPLPHDARLEQAALVFLSSFYAHWEFERRIGERFDHAALRLRTHAVRLHRTLRPGDWLLLRASSRIASDGRAVGTRELFARGGDLVATATSEALVAEAH
jgi:acyl-CoA thioesterase-2